MIKLSTPDPRRLPRYPPKARIRLASNALPHFERNTEHMSWLPSRGLHRKR